MFENNYFALDKILSYKINFYFFTVQITVLKHNIL